MISDATRLPKFTRPVFAGDPQNPMTDLMGYREAPSLNWICLADNYFGTEFPEGQKVSCTVNMFFPNREIAPDVRNGMNIDGNALNTESLKESVRCAFGIWQGQRVLHVYSFSNQSNTR